MNIFIGILLGLFALWSVRTRFENELLRAVVKEQEASLQKLRRENTGLRVEMIKYKGGVKYEKRTRGI